MDRHPFLAALGLLLLAALCVGATELAAARFEAPAAYEEFMDPLRDAGRGARRIWDTVSGDVARAIAARREERQRELERRAEAERRLAEERAAREAALLAAQVASEPSISEKPVIADPTITEFQTQDGREVLTGGNVLIYYYNQADEAWADKPFGSDPIGRYGCGPTVMAMAVASLTGDLSADPASVALWAGQAGYCSPRSGSYLSLIAGAAEHYGLNCDSLGETDAAGLYEALSEGALVVALMGPGHFTGGGHFILLHGGTLTGEVLVADPNSRENSLAVWEAQTIVDELSRSRHDGAPLWLLTKPLSL